MGSGATHWEGRKKLENPIPPHKSQVPVVQAMNKDLEVSILKIGRYDFVSWLNDLLDLHLGIHHDFVYLEINGRSLCSAVTED